MRIPVLFFLCLLLITPARATHIVGGEFALTYISGSSYQLSLHLYFDNVNGNPGAREPTAPVFIYEKATNKYITTYYLPLRSQTPVAYTAVACTNPALSTDKINYSASINLSNQVYTHPGGYYAVWERCCRNNTISNIVRPDNAGQVFYMEFPPVQVDGQPFRNSSPELFPPLSDYACLNELFYYDFGGKDADGDSLVYEMATPLNGNTTAAAPTPAWPLPAPYTPVTWTSGLGTNFQIPGNPTVQIAGNTGRLTLQPSRLGLFVFGIRCSEYRNKVKIGEVRRDFQLMVLSCPKNETPKIQVRQAGKRSFYQEGEVIQVNAAETPCLDLFVSDIEPNAALTMEARPVNFSLSEQIIALKSGLVNRNGVKDTLSTTACFPTCLNSAGKTYLMDFIVSDNGCSLPRKDTIRVAFQVMPIPNAGPAITTTAPALVLRPRLGEQIVFDVTGTDPDQDLVSLDLAGVDFDKTQQALSFPGRSANGQVTAPFSWTIDCNAVSRQAVYTLKFTVTTTSCGQLMTRSTLVEVRPDHSNAPPQMHAAMAGKTIQVTPGSAFTDTIYGTDTDLHQIAITAQGQGFELTERDMKFLPASGVGRAKAVFTWQPACLVTSAGLYTVNFTLTETTCNPAPPQTMAVSFQVGQQDTGPFIPSNIFTPNDDGLNDYFVLPALPPDFCNSLFASIKIFNRWGGLVYESQDRNFKWNGSHITDGVYYYHIYYTDKIFKGMVTVVR